MNRHQIIQKTVIVATALVSEPCALWPFFKTSRQFKNPLAT